MGGKKRSRDDSYDNIMNKIRKLEEKVKKKSRRHRRRRISTSSESSDSDSGDGDYVNDESPDLVISDNEFERSDENCIIEPSQPEEVADADLAHELNQDILKILGDDSCASCPFGENLHKDVVTRWQHILLNGLSKEIRTELLKTYLPPENCPNMRAPKLNLEIKAALTELNNKKDAYAQSKQNQLASCLSAVGKALNLVITKTKDDASQEVIKALSDAGRLLCDYHYKESQSRRYAIINTLNKQTRDTIKNTKIDEYLFGSDLAEHLKSAKAISKSGLELRSTTTDNRPKPKALNSGQNPAVRRGTLNARGAPQATAAETRAYPAPRRNYAAPAPAPARNRYSYNSKTTHRHRGRRT